jgi:hypothetical protein
MDWRVAQVLEQLLCKCKALSSNPSPMKERKKEKKKEKTNHVCRHVSEMRINGSLGLNGKGYCILCRLP